MDRKSIIGFALWIVFCLAVIGFSIVYVIIGQIQATSNCAIPALTFGAAKTIASAIKGGI